MQFLPPFFTVQAASAPLPVPFLSALREIQIETSTVEAGVLRLRFDLSRTATGDWDALQVDIFWPLAPIRISVRLGGLPEAIINGYVHSAKLDNRSEAGKSTLEVVAMDATATRMNLQERMMLWPNLPDSAIATAIFGKHVIMPLVVPTPASRTVPTTTTIQRGTDIRLLKELARRNSFECYVQPDPVLGTDTGYFGPPRITVPWQGVLSVDFGVSTNMESFDANYAMLEPTSAVAAVLDPATKKPQPVAAPAALEPPMGREPALFRIVPPPVVRPIAGDAANAAELRATSASIANRSSRCIRGSGEVDGLRYGRVLRPGLPVLVRGAGLQHSGLYYVTRVTHSISTSRYSQRFEAWRNAVGLTGAEIFVDPMGALS